MEVNTDILTSFLCSFCRDLTHPPIDVCPSGHPCCRKCNNFNKVCRICNKSKCEGRNYGLEHLYEIFQFPCNYRAEGCSFVSVGSAVKEHISTCPFIAIDCPLRLLKCKWHGKVADLFKHVSKEHPKHAVELKSASEMLRVYTKVLPSTYSQVIIQAYSEVFLFTWWTNANRSVIKWSLVYLGSKENGKCFYYTIEFQNPLEKCETIIMEAQCQTLAEYKSGTKIKSETFNDENYLRHIVNDINFHYVIKLKQKQNSSPSLIL